MRSQGSKNLELLRAEPHGVDSLGRDRPEAVVHVLLGNGSKRHPYLGELSGEMIRLARQFRQQMMELGQSEHFDWRKLPLHREDYSHLHTWIAASSGLVCWWRQLEQMA